MPSIDLITKAVIGLAIAAALYFVGHFIYQSGVEATDAAWLQRQTDQANESAKKLADRQRAADAREIDHLKEMSEAANKYMVESAENERKHANEKAAVTGTARTTGLWVDVRRPAFGGMPATFGAGAAGALDGAGETSRARLSESADDFFIAIGNDADREVSRLKLKVNALQDLVETYRKVCK